MKNTIYIINGIVLFLLCSCAPNNLTRGSLYSKMYEEKPNIILIMPPINKTNTVEAKQYFYSSLALPLTEKGYYIISPLLSMDLLKQESAYDSEQFINGSLTPFGKIFGADAALFTVINKWNKNNLLNTITVNIEYCLRSVKTGEVLFNRKGELNVNCGTSNNGGGGLLSLAINIAANAVSTALTDKIIAARRCNAFVLTDLPAGKYSVEYGKDMNTKAGKTFFKGSVNK